MSVKNPKKAHFKCMEKKQKIYSKERGNIQENENFIWKTLLRLFVVKFMFLVQILYEKNLQKCKKIAEMKKKSQKIENS